MSYSEGRDVKDAIVAAPLPIPNTNGVIAIGKRGHFNETTTAPRWLPMLVTLRTDCRSTA